MPKETEGLTVGELVEAKASPEAQQYDLALITKQTPDGYRVMWCLGQKEGMEEELPETLIRKKQVIGEEEAATKEGMVEPQSLSPIGAKAARVAVGGA